MTLLNANKWLTVLVLGTVWTLVIADVGVAQTKQGSFVVRDPVASGYPSRQGQQAVNSGIPMQSVPATRKFLPANWAPRQDKDVSPEAQLDRDVDSIDLQDKFQDQLQGEIQKAAELDDEQLLKERRLQFDFGTWPRRTISEIRMTVKDDNAVVPPDKSYLLTEMESPDWFTAPSGDKVFAWVAPNIHYQPLYFQDVPLERYGQTCGGLKQIGASGLHFFTSFCRLPYAVIVDPPRSCEYPLGYCRPGNPAPLTHQKLLYPCRD